MSVPLYTSKLEAVGDALAARIQAAPVLAAEGCEVVSRVDDTIASQIEERVAKAGGLLCVVALLSTAPNRRGEPGPRIRAQWNLSLWARRATRGQRNAGPTLYEAMLAQVQGWRPEGGLCYEEFGLVSGAHRPHPKYSLYDATFEAVVQIGRPTLSEPEGS